MEKTPEQLRQQLTLEILLAHANKSLPCCKFDQFDELIISGKVTSASGHYVKHMEVDVSTVYQIDQIITDDDIEEYKNNGRNPLMFFKVWCNANDPQLPKDGHTKLWFDFSANDTMVARVIKAENL